MASLAAQLLTVSILTLQRQIYHNRGLHLNDNSVWWNSSYDFVIVGGGSAGCVLASRLTEIASVSVLVIEAGGPVNVMTDIMPSFFAQENTWRYQTVPQRYSGLARVNQTLGFARGRVLGGSGTINLAAYNRGNRRLFDSWGTTYGLGSNWTFNSMLPYFIRAENNTDPAIVNGNYGFHGTTGPWEVVSCPNPDPIFQRWLNAVNQFGWPINIDINGPTQFGATMSQTAQSRTNYTRQSAYSAYIEPNIARSNLHILPNTLVTRILYSSSSRSPQATGVQFMRNNQMYQVMATREVIISGGVINSPQILMLSGIGPAQHLQNFGIPVLVDSPGVGSRLVDHVAFTMDFLMQNESDIGWATNIYYSFTTQNLYQFMAQSWGPLIRYPGLQMYIPTGISGDMDIPDGNLLLFVNMINPDVNAAAAGLTGSHEDWLNYYRPLAGNRRHFALDFNNYRPLSTGTVRLASANPMHSPLIDPNLFSNRQDLDAIVRQAQMAIQMIESQYLSPYLQYTPVPVPGCPFCNDRPLSQCPQYIQCVAQSLTSISCHPVGTCAMGNASNTMAVVDEQLRVRGVSNLRVVDASVMPEVPNANTNAAVIMIAEKAADFIRRQYGFRMH